MFHSTEELPALMSVAQLCAFLNVARQTVYNWRQLGVGPKGFKHRGKLMYRREVVIKWVEECETEEAARLVESEVA